MAHQFRQELFSKAPTEHDECIRAVDIWITRLEMIRSGLANFPVLKSECETSTVAQSPAMTPSVYGSPTHEGATQVPQVGPSQASITECLERDQYQCIITRRKLSKGFATEVVPWLERGLVRPVVDSVFAFDDFAQAQARVESNLVFGKVVLRL